MLEFWAVEYSFEGLSHFKVFESKALADAWVSASVLKIIGEVWQL